MSLNDEVTIVHVGETGIDGTGITAAEKLQITSDLAELQALAEANTGAIVANAYYGPLSTLGGGSAAGRYNRFMDAGQLYAAPFTCPADAEFNVIGAYVAVAGAAGTTLRLGIYESGADGLPGPLLYDVGTVTVDATGFRNIIAGMSLGKGGTYWIAGAASGTYQVLADQSQNIRPYAGYIYNDGTFPIAVFKRTTDLASGFTALPNPFGAMSAVAGVPFFWLRAV